ncbi:KRAB-A domain-containing protein 2-like [Aphis gossypii]|uniref:KRAB-A domain-containing protein 2-like n=1 Tax=Aphis gossypii TaxID=80765 RepID=UPI002158C0A1|nr:KRAB-A domain-containing protein 2-like [Aphis gossypii]
MSHNQLIVPLKPGDTKIIYFVKNEDLFDIIHDAHIKTGHGRRTRVISELQTKYKNITYESVTLFLSLCVQCQRKQKVPKKGIVVKPIISRELNSRCQVDLVDMQTCKDGEYKFILNYQDHLTKFIQLRPLKSKTAEEVALTLLPIFLTFGAPNILHSDNGREFSNKIIIDLCSRWEGVKIVHGKPRHSQCQGSIERANQDFQNILRAMMHDKKTTKWSEALPFVQFAKNTAYHQGIKQTPYEAMFGSVAKRGLATSSLPREQIKYIETEEQLEQIIQSIDDDNTEQVEQNDNDLQQLETILQSIDDDNTEQVEQNGNDIHSAERVLVNEIQYNNTEQVEDNAEQSKLDHELKKKKKT